MTGYRFPARLQPPVGVPRFSPAEIDEAGGPDSWLTQGPPQQPLEQLTAFARPLGPLYGNDADAQDTTALEYFETYLEAEAPADHRLRWLWAAALLAAALRPRPRNDLDAARSILDLAEPAVRRLRALTSSPLELPDRDIHLTRTGLLRHLASGQNPRVQAVADAAATYAGKDTSPLLAMADTARNGVDKDVLTVRTHSVPFPTVVSATGQDAGRLLVFHAAAWATPLPSQQPAPYPSLVWMPSLPDEDFRQTVDDAWHQARHDCSLDAAVQGSPVAWWIADNKWEGDVGRFQPSQHAIDPSELEGPSAGAAAYLAFRAALTGTHLDLQALSGARSGEEPGWPVAVTGPVPEADPGGPPSVRGSAPAEPNGAAEPNGPA